MECNVYLRDDYSGFWKRTLANTLDGTLLGILLTLIGIMFKDATATVVQILLWLTYMIGFKGTRGSTPGYQALDMKLVAVNGDEVTIKQIIVRLISSIFSFVALGLGFFWIVIDAKKQAWHDKIAGTYVVRSDAIPFRREAIPQKSLIRVPLFAAQFLVTGGLLTGMYLLLSQPTVARGRTAIDELHRLYHAGDYVSIYNGSDPTLQQKLTKEDAVLRLSQVRDKFGNVVSLRHACHYFTLKKDTGTLRMEYDVTFEKGKATETYDWRLDGKETRLLAYAVEASEKDKPDWEMALAPPGIRPNASTCWGAEQQVHWWQQGQGKDAAKPALW